jgi:hypothetical protein
LRCVRSFCCGALHKKNGNGDRLVFVDFFPAGAEAGVEATKTFVSFCFCDGEDYTERHKKSLNARGTILNIKCQVAFAPPSVYDLAYDVVSFDEY